MVEEEFNDVNNVISLTSNFQPASNAWLNSALSPWSPTPPAAATVPFKIKNNNPGQYQILLIKITFKHVAEINCKITFYNSVNEQQETVRRYTCYGKIN